MPQTTVFCADFADYPFMQESAIGLAGESQLIIGGQGRVADNQATTLDRYEYFDWRRYFRLADFQASIPATDVIDPERLPVYEEPKRQFMRSLDRVFLHPDTYANQERFFYGLVTAFEAWVHRSPRPLTVFFAHTPHFPWHLAFYHVCRVLEIPVYIFRTTQIADAILVDAALSSASQQWVRPQQPIDPTWVMDQAWARSPRMANSVSINERAETHAHKRLGPLRWLMIRWRYFRDRKYLRNTHYHRLGWRDIMRAAKKRHRERRADLRYLDKHAAKTVPQGDYAYFGLHYQPERTTVPEAGYFHDQIRAIRMLADALPTGFTLAVKEHPRQLGDRRPSLRRLHSSRRGLYEAIQRIPNAVLIHAFVESAGLIRQARMTASCTGSAVFEGLQAGIPGVTFAATWHSACTSGPFCADGASLRLAVDTLLQRATQDVRADYQRFLETHAQFWFLGANDDRAVKRSAYSRAELSTSVNRILRALTVDRPANQPADLVTMAGPAANERSA